MRHCRSFKRSVSITGPFGSAAVAASSLRGAIIGFIHLISLQAAYLARGKERKAGTTAWTIPVMLTKNAHQQWEGLHELASRQRPRARGCEILRRSGADNRAAHARSRRWIRGAPRLAAWPAPDGRPVHLLRSFRAGAVHGGQGDGRAPASAHRPRDRHLSVRWQHHASR